MRTLSLFFFCLICLGSRAQQYDFVPKEYHLMTAEEKEKLKPPFKGVSFLMENGKYLANKDVALMKKGGYEQLYFGDSTGNVRIIVNRKLTESELEQRKQSYDNLRQESDQALAGMKGKNLADLGLTYLDGHSFEAGSDKPTLYFFWFAKCGQCERLITEINRQSQKYKGKMDFVSPTLDNKEAAENFLKNRRLPQPLLADKAVLATQRIDFFPTIIIADKEGKVLMASSQENLAQELEDFLGQLFSGR